MIGRPVHEEKFAAGTVDNSPIGHFMGTLSQGVRAWGGLWLAQVKFEGAFVDEYALMVAELGDGLNSARMYCGIPSCEPGPDMPKFAMARLEAPTVNPIAAAPRIVRDERPSDIAVLRVSSLPEYLAPDLR